MGHISALIFSAVTLKYAFVSLKHGLDGAGATQRAGNSRNTGHKNHSFAEVALYLKAIVYFWLVACIGFTPLLWPRTPLLQFVDSKPAWFTDLRPVIVAKC